MKVTTLGIDLAKNVFQVHGIDQHGKVMLKKQLKRAQMAPFFINLRRVSSALRHAAVRITGRANFRQWVTPCA